MYMSGTDFLNATLKRGNTDKHNFIIKNQVWQVYGEIVQWEFKLKLVGRFPEMY